MAVTIGTIEMATDDALPKCWQCGGPVLHYAGSVHGWRCRRCLDKYLDASAARADANDLKERNRLLAKHFRKNTTNSRKAQER